MIPRDVTSGCKAYDTATAYDKAIPYYGAYISGVYPVLSSVNNTRPRFDSIDNTKPQLGAIL